MLRGVQIETDDIGRLRLEVRIVGGHIAVQPMWLEPMLGPDPGHPHMAYPELDAQLAAAPVSRPVGGRPSRGLQDAGFRLRGLRPRCLPPMPTVQPGQSLVGKALPPQGHKAATAPDLVADGIPGPTRGQQQNHPGAPGVFGSPRSALRSFHQFSPFQFCQCHDVRHEHHYSL